MLKLEGDIKMELFVKVCKKCHQKNYKSDIITEEKLSGEKIFKCLFCEEELILAEEEQEYLEQKIKMKG